MSGERDATAPLPFGSVGKTGVGWWAVLCLIATEAALFGYLLFAYAFTYVQEGAAWGPAKPPHLRLAGPNTLLLIASSLVVWWAERGIKSGRTRQLALGVGVSILLGAAFVLIQLKEWRDKTFSLNASGYASHYYTITGFHLAHVVAGLLALTLLLVWSLAGYFDRERHAAVTYVTTYWHFVDVVWLFVFTAFYLAPRVG